MKYRNFMGEIQYLSYYHYYNALAFVYFIYFSSYLLFTSLDMSESSEECVKKISSVNLDKLIDDFSQIEKVCKDIKQL